MSGDRVQTYECIKACEMYAVAFRFLLPLTLLTVALTVEHAAAASAASACDAF